MSVNCVWKICEPSAYVRVQWQWNLEKNTAEFRVEVFEIFSNEQKNIFEILKFWARGARQTGNQSGIQTAKNLKKK